MRVNWFELMALPAYIVQDWIDDLNAQAAHQGEDTKPTQDLLAAERANDVTG